MLDELLYVFLRALEFDGDDPLPLINEWNAAVAHVQEVFDRMTDKDSNLMVVKRGQWISDSPGKRFGKPVRLDKDGCPVDSCHCSECGDWLTASDEYPARGRYCPNCGAKMSWEVNDA